MRQEGEEKVAKTISSSAIVVSHFAVSPRYPRYPAVASESRNFVPPGLNYGTNAFPLRNCRCKQRFSSWLYTELKALLRTRSNEAAVSLPFQERQYLRAYRFLRVSSFFFLSRCLSFSSNTARLSAICIETRPAGPTFSFKFVSKTSDSTYTEDERERERERERVRYQDPFLARRSRRMNNQFIPRLLPRRKQFIERFKTEIRLCEDSSAESEG